MADRLPEGSLVLISGANGFIGSHIIDQLLKHGYRVRGTVRDTTKNAWLQSFFEERYGKGKLELVQVPDAGKEGAFDEAIKGAAAFAHVASDLSFSPDPNVIIPGVVASVKNALASAAKEPGLKSFVLTSSSTAATKPYPGKKYHLSKDSWNEAEVEEAWGPPPYEPERAWSVYGASKTQGEQAAWAYVRENKPHFTFNSILPNANFGSILQPEHQQGSTGAWIPGILGEGYAKLSKVSSQYYVNVVDTALLHVAALTDLSINNERIFAFAEIFSWNQIFDIIRHIRPDLSVPADLEGEVRDTATVDNQQAEAILKTRFGKGWTPLEEAVKDNLAHYKQSG